MYIAAVIKVQRLSQKTRKVTPEKKSLFGQFITLYRDKTVTIIHPAIILEDKYNIKVSHVIINLSFMLIKLS